ncbi:response regulator [Ulvibacterium sp.]|uniref:response regulator n=1 Tax=Ulvibacterium sp. TaxID=2665914 RepID=UPI002611CC9D|nr:response regulator [Ulvibacterium sp.]
MYTEIYLVDDLEMTNVMHQVLFRQLGMEDRINAYTNPEEALDSLRMDKDNAAQKLVLLDICMPEMTGFEFLEFMVLEEFPESIDVIIVTSSTEPADKILAEQYPQFVKGFVQKPLQIENLVEIMSGSYCM